MAIETRDWGLREKDRRSLESPFVLSRSRLSLPRSLGSGRR